MQDRHRRLQNAPAVFVFIFLNVLAFLVELARGGLTDPAALHRLGALDPYSVMVDHEYWRLFTALFLHYGAIHLLFNLFALYVLGPGLERTIGSVRFSLCYLVSGLGSTSGVIALTLMHLVRPAELVGASGCVMGIVGAWAGFLLRHRYAPRAKERLLNILLIVAIQFVFDISTPQVSMAAHLCGLATGLIVGLLIAPRDESAAA
jgi:rhomboid protease GluP